METAEDMRGHNEEWDSRTGEMLDGLHRAMDYGRWILELSHVASVAVTNARPTPDMKEAIRSLCEIVDDMSSACVALELPKHWPQERPFELLRSSPRSNTETEEE